MIQDLLMFAFLLRKSSVWIAAFAERLWNYCSSVVPTDSFAINKLH